MLRIGKYRITIVEDEECAWCLEHEGSDSSSCPMPSWIETIVETTSASDEMDFEELVPQSSPADPKPVLQMEMGSVSGVSVEEPKRCVGRQYDFNKIKLFTRNARRVAVASPMVINTASPEETERIQNTPRASDQTPERGQNNVILEGKSLVADYDDGDVALVPYYDDETEESDTDSDCQIISP